jgi:hypothetical protein
MRIVWLPIVLGIFFLGCQQENTHRRPHVLGQEPVTTGEYAQSIVDNAAQPKGEALKMKRLELKTQKEIERIRAEKELQIEKMRIESDRSQRDLEKELTLKKLEAEVEKSKGERTIQGWVVALTALFFFLLLWVGYKLFKEYQAYRLRLEEERIRHEKEMQEKELQSRLAEKMFEALGSGNLNEEQQNRLLDSLGHPGRQLELKRQPPPETE